MVAIFAFLIPIGAGGPSGSEIFSSGKPFVLRNDKSGRAFEMQPREINATSRGRVVAQKRETSPVAAREWYRSAVRSARAPYKKERRKVCRRASNTGRSAVGKEHADAKKKNREREPFDAAEIGGDLRLRSGINGLEKSVCENSMINYRAIDEPAEARRAVNLSSPLRRSGWSEKNEMFEAQE